MIRRPPRSTLSSSSAASDVYKRQSVLLVEVRDHLGVAVAREAVTLGRELRPQLAVVVDLAVLRDPDATVLVRQRLVARLQVDDRKAPRRDTDAAVEESTLAIGASVHELGVHRGQLGRVDAASSRDDPTDPAHGEGV